MTTQIKTSRESVDCIQSSIEKLTKPLPTYGKYEFLLWKFETPVKWINVFFITLWHIIAVWALYQYPFWEHWALVVYGFILGGLGGFGVTAGAHRYWTHKSFKAKLPLRVLLLFCFSMTGQNSLKEWVRDHRVHHKFSETDADPHNANRGFFFAHVGWLMMKRHPEVIKKGRTVDISDLFQDPLVAFHERHFFWFKLIFCFILPSLIPPYLWGESWRVTIFGVCFIRYMASLNCTWATNSAAHLWGNRPYDKRIFPAENLAVSFLAMGEGYHNYHHTFPWDYRTSELGRRLNITTFWLNIFQYIGWAYDMKTPSPTLVKAMMEKHGDGSHLKWGHEVPIEENSRLLEVKKIIKNVKPN